MIAHWPPNSGAEFGASTAAGSSASTGLVSLNATYVHLALSLRYLRNAARDAGFSNVWLREYTIRTPLAQMVDELAALVPAKGGPAVLGFSVYIWNREPTFALIAALKARLPHLTIVIGGPEVSFETGPPIPEVDVVIAGEGERKWVEFLQGWAAGWGSGIPGTGVPDAATRNRWIVYDADIPALGRLPYLEEDFVDLEHRLAYLETSRGCPFSCSFCLSALDKQVRFFPDQGVKETVKRLVAAGARRIKFLDRTFNLRKSRVLEFFRFLAAFEGVEFHFEVVGDLLDDAMIAFLETVPRGRFQFEIGVQSADPAVNARVDRHQSQPKLFAMMQRLRVADRVHVHADLIWGLPGEPLPRIRESFETVLALRPHELQLGFLKFLPGAPIRALIESHGYRYDPHPPYELISHRDLTENEVQRLKRFEDGFDRVYNSGHFRFTLDCLLTRVNGWELFEALAGRLDSRRSGSEGESIRRAAAPPSLEDLAAALLETGSELASGATHGPLSRALLRDLIKLDYFCHHRARRVPGFLQGAAVQVPPGARSMRKADPETAIAPFDHKVEWNDEAPGTSTPRLVPSATTRWLAFSYRTAHQGYFFLPAVTDVTERIGAVPMRPGASDTANRERRHA